MSSEQAHTFLSRLNDDEQLGKKADDAFVIALLAVAKQAGYDLSEPELRAALDGEGGAMADEELDQVAGGFGRFANTVTTVGLADTIDNVAGRALGALTINSFSKKGFTR